MNFPNFPEGKRPRATDVSPWLGFYRIKLDRYSSVNNNELKKRGLPWQRLEPSIIAGSW